MNNYYCYILKLNPSFYRNEDWTEKETELVGVHFNYLKDLTNKGNVFLAGRTVNEPMTDKDLGIVIIEAESEDEARGYMENDPAIIGNLMTAEFFEFSLALLRK
ncbi:MAG TPA: YciI family protein [Ignavibacteria bacterium]|nr:YciI family protein [Ignavibacteria bacterium]HQY52089.1 YciI family protein [Ignavibacteria bacterium]HRB00003.1 YciI family protein [Ignavibacteria bacterium]